MLDSEFSMLDSRYSILDARCSYCVSREVYRVRENLDAISLSNCPKLSDEPRIKTVE